ncbi:PAS domain-containing sensor histidine kinase [Marivirga sp.]|uniref:PAS domain-containing sensor histidine kinase n=1 Tax=Marivirga sp. TaxID=2018662 RepID=UPI002D7E575C|nr:PAS domain-containing sensor histidine kinase [Marivirga sp.]HET8858676.1 PAS domain-containing sensor histidine kinase [Marivirga sp.]
MNTHYLHQIEDILKTKKLSYQFLESFNITDFQDFRCYFILIDDSILYVISIGNADSATWQLFFQNLRSASKIHQKQKLTFIMDASQLGDIPSSSQNELEDYQLFLRESWSKVYFINENLDNTVLESFRDHNSQFAEDVETLNKPHLAIEYALNGHSDNSYENYLNSLSREELIEEAKNLKSNKLVENSEKESNQLLNILKSFKWNKEETKLFETSEKNTFSPFYEVLNSISTDYKNINQKLESLTEEFNNKLQFQVGEILHQEASLRAIFDTLDSMIWLVDSEFNLMAFNQKFRHHLESEYGITPEVGMNVLEQSDLLNKYEKTLDRIKKALKGKEENYRDFYKKDGEVVKVVDSKIFPVILNRNISGVACLTNDISESFEEKERIKSNERIIASVNKNISEAIYRTSHEKGLIFVNEAFVKMFGFDSKEELYQHAKLNSLYENPNDRERLGKFLIKVKEVTNVEVKFRKKNGDIFTGLLSSMVSEDEDGTKYFDGAIRDVTAIKSAQEKLQNQNSELKKLNTELDSFVYSASHDLKAPLSSVKGLINLAKNETSREKLADYLDLVDKSINKLDNFIKDIVDLSRNARQEVQSELIDFNEILTDTLDNYHYLENYDKIKKHIKIEDDIPFYSDKRRLKVIFNNLISNAIRYFNPYSDNPFVKINVKTDSKRAVIKIADNGLGIQSQYLEKIFEMFFRASNNSKGTGIGLYIVKETIQKIKGQINVESELEKGTIFTVIIPNLKS